MTSIRIFRSDFGHVSVLSAGNSFVTHAHPELQIVIHIGGAPGTMTVDGQQVRPDAAIAVGVNSLEPHSHSFPADREPGRFLAFYLDPDWVRDRYGVGPRVFRQTAIALNRSLRLASRDLLDHLMEVNGAGVGVLHHIEAMIDCIVDAAGNSALGQRHPARNTADFRIRRAIETMKANMCDRMGVDELARSVGLSRPHFFALFKTQTQLTPNVYWNTLRMDKAVRQLRATEDSMIDLAISLGFTSQSNFTRFFRDHTGVPPTLYREASRASG